MPILWLIGIVLAIALAAYIVGRARAMRSAGGDIRNLHSLPSYYGWNAAIRAMIPAFVLMMLWLVAQPIYVKNVVFDMIPAGEVAEGSSPGLVMAEIQRISTGLDNAVRAGALTREQARDGRADLTDMTKRLQDAGQIVTGTVTQGKLQAAQEYRRLSGAGSTAMTALVLALALGGAAMGIVQNVKDYRARTSVEASVRWLLISAALIAILTTVGIVLSLAFNTIEFFRMYNWADYLFGTTWAPRSGGGRSQALGLLPLLWGTLYISFIALLVAVPIGLFAAIYLSEYASPKVRGTVKPALEILAGIPSIVYGLFALLTVGPALMSVFGRDGLGIMQGASSVMTAGLVMGIMLIPFVSSLSDDIINAVPQAMRDGSYGLGATQSETIRQVLLPAALPGIVGAIILAASRAIGETMLVVFGAGAAGRLSMNPFEAMTTVTAKIVSQLTGDADFTQPEVLVAYALGTTLFIVTLLLNYLAQHVVAKYREQYS